jgi:hypothetical protein
LFRPTTPLWTHLSTNEKINAPLPSSDTLKYSRTVQDATWYIGNYTTAPYVEEFADYFTKYTVSDEWRDHKVHGVYGDGSQSKDGSTFGAWLVMNTVDTYFGGPTHSDLTVDGIVYNYICESTVLLYVLPKLTSAQLQTTMEITSRISQQALTELSDLNTSTSTKVPTQQP